MRRSDLRDRHAYLKRREAETREEAREESRAVKKEKLAAALTTCTRIPHALRGEAKGLLDEMIYNVEAEEELPPPPRIAVTTSHDPSSLLRAFSKHLSLVFNGQHLLRGRMTMSALSEYCRSGGVTHLFIIHETKGNPSSLTLCCYPHGPTYRFSLFHLKFQRRAKTMGEKAYLVVDGMGSELGTALRRALALCFPAVEDGNRLVAFVNRDGIIAFRHFLIESRKLVKECEFDLRLYNVTNSTVEVEGTVGYVLNAFTNTRRDDVLAADATD